MPKREIKSSKAELGEPVCETNGQHLNKISRDFKFLTRFDSGSTRFDP